MSRGSENVTQKDATEVIAHTLQTQSSVIKTLDNSETINEIKQAAEIIDNSEGRTVFTGVGKSGDVGRKIVATFNSIGASSHFIHPVEALHGDLGMVSVLRHISSIQSKHCMAILEWSQRKMLSY